MEISQESRSFGVFVMTSFLPGSQSFVPKLLRCGILLAALGSGEIRLARAQDCNHNGVADLEDIARGGSPDCNRNSIPDECEDGFPGKKANLTGVAPLGLIAADLDGDRRVDIATCNSLSNDVSVLLGNGDGTFLVEARFGVGVDPSALIASDLDGDGHLDLATANMTSNNVSVRLGNGEGAFQREVRFAVGNRPWALIASDFNGDGRMDLATANSGSLDVSILLGNGNGAFKDEVHFDVGRGLGAFCPTARANSHPRVRLLLKDYQGVG